METKNMGFSNSYPKDSSSARDTGGAPEIFSENIAAA